MLFLVVLAVFASTALHPPAAEEDAELRETSAAAKRSPRAAPALWRLCSGHVRRRSWHGGQGADEECVVPRRSWDGSHQLYQFAGVDALEMVKVMTTGSASDVLVSNKQQQQPLRRSRLGPHGGAEGSPRRAADEQEIEQHLQTETFDGAEGDSFMASLIPTPQEEHDEGVVPQRSWNGSLQRHRHEFPGVDVLEMVTGSATEVLVCHKQQKQLLRGSRLGPHGGTELQRCSQTETLGGAGDVGLTANLLQKPEEVSMQSSSQATATAGSGTALDLTLGNAIIPVSEDMSSTRETRREDCEDEEVKGHLKFSYFATGIAGAGIISIYTGFLGNQTGHTHDIYLKVFTVLMMAAFTSGASLIVLTFHCLCIRVPIQIIKRLKYTTLGYLILAVLDICIMFLKGVILLAVLLAFLPIFLVMMTELMLRLCKDRLSRIHHQFNSGLHTGSFLRLSSKV